MNNKTFSEYTRQMYNKVVEYVTWLENIPSSETIIPQIQELLTKNFSKQLEEIRLDLKQEMNTEDAWEVITSIENVAKMIVDNFDWCTNKEQDLYKLLKNQKKVLQENVIPQKIEDYDTFYQTI